MNEKHGKSNPYTVEVSYEQMWKLGAHVDLIRATCNSINNRHLWLVPAAKRFLRDKGLVNESNETCLSFTGFPQSMQTLEEFRRGCSLVQHVPAFEGKIAILAPTVDGRLLVEMSMVAITENHSQYISWGGNFSENDILIIKWSSKRRRVNYKTYEMKILQDPVKDTERKLHTAMVRDMRRTSEIFIPLYKIGDDLPVYFAELKEDLEGAKEAIVAKEWFREYLCYHVALMPSTARRGFEVLLHTMYTSCDMGYMPIMTAKPTVYPNDWRQLLNFMENVGLPLSSDRWKRSHSSTWTTSVDRQIDILHDVYSHNNNPTVERNDKYENSARGLLRFKRNFVEHGGQGRSIRYIADLELCAAKRVGKFLPWLVRSLLENGQMVTRFGVAWNDFMVSQADQSDPWSC